MKKDRKCAYEECSLFTIHMLHLFTHIYIEVHTAIYHDGSSSIDDIFLFVFILFYVFMVMSRDSLHRLSLWRYTIHILVNKSSWICDSVGVDLNDVYFVFHYVYTVVGQKMRLKYTIVNHLINFSG